MDSYSFPHLEALSRELAAPVLVYDLESTTYRGSKNFGITEVATLKVDEGGGCDVAADLINPERPIDPRVIELNGITQAMVRHKETWGARYAGVFQALARGPAWVGGFNNHTFDDRAVIEMNARYGQPIGRFELTFDVRKLHRLLSGAKSTAGTLLEIASRYGARPRAKLHRALADTVLTAETLEGLVMKYGASTVARAIAEGAQFAPAAPVPVSPRARASAVAVGLLDYVRSREGSVSLEEVAQALGKEPHAVSFDIGKAIDERAIHPGAFARPEVQARLAGMLREIEPALLTQGKLKPIYERVNAAAAMGEVDYVQLRIALLTAGISWSTLKPAGT